MTSIFETLNNGITIKETEKGFEVYPAAAWENWDGWHEVASTLEKAHEIAENMGIDWAHEEAEQIRNADLFLSWDEASSNVVTSE